MIFLSPGVKTEEIDYSTYVGQLSTCIVGMVGEATKGPMNVPTLITSPTNFVLSPISPPDRFVNRVLRF